MSLFSICAILAYCRQVGITIVLRPPHTTHVLQGEGTTHFLIFKDGYEQAKMLALGRKVLSGACRLTAADLLSAAKTPWEQALSQQRCLEAWASIGVTPFNEKVYWDLRAAEDKAKNVAICNEVNPELFNAERNGGDHVRCGRGAATSSSAEWQATQARGLSALVRPLGPARRRHG